MVIVTQKPTLVGERDLGLRSDGSGSQFGPLPFCHSQQEEVPGGFRED